MTSRAAGLRAGVAAAAIGICACATDASERLPATIAVSSPVAPLRMDEYAQLDVVVKTRRGTVLTDEPMAWSSSDSLVIAVTDSGRIHAVEHGTATLTATTGRVSGAVTLNVEGRPQTIAIGRVLSTGAIDDTPQFPIFVGETIQLIATAVDSEGTALVREPIAWRLEWLVGQGTDLATLDPSARVTAVRPGRLRVHASAQSADRFLTIIIRETLPVVGGSPPLSHHRR